MDLPLSHIFIRSDARKVDAAAVAGLAASIAEIGIINPLRVRPARRMVEGVQADAWEVTAGVHRLKAAQKVGLDTVPCIVVEDDDLRAELAMIDENLCRAELSPADRAKQTARRKELYLELHPETAQGSPGVSRQVGDTHERTEKERFTEATAKVVGISERAVQRDAERGEKVAQDVLDRIRGTHLDTGTYLDALKKLTPEEQRARVERALAQPKAKPTRISKEPLNDFEAKEKQVARLMDAWNAASAEAREEFMGRIDRPVMDRRFA